MQGEDRPGRWFCPLVDTRQHLDTGLGHIGLGMRGVDDWQLGEDQSGTLPTLLHCARSSPNRELSSSKRQSYKVEKSRVKGLLQTSREDGSNSD